MKLFFGGGVYGKLLKSQRVSRIDKKCYSLIIRVSKTFFIMQLVLFGNVWYPKLL